MQQPSNHGLLTAFTYYALKDNKTLNVFKNWVIKNHIYHTKDIKAEELIKVFDCVLESRHRTIFVSMQFSEETKRNYKAIKCAIDDINTNYNLDLKIREIRIDEYSTGCSYKITDEILELIDGCGLLIADLSLGNKNVYHEIGYLMGANKGKKLPQENFLLIFNEAINKADFDSDVGFNIKDFKILISKDDISLKDKLTEEIKCYYSLK